jgi:hypothetical protein
MTSITFWRGGLADALKECERIIKIVPNILKYFINNPAT